MTTGILLFAHGARDPNWARPFEQARDRLASPDADGTTRPVCLSFLEFMSPNLIDGGQALVDQGCQRVTVVPLFLGAGGHVRKDLPVLMAQLQSQHPGIQWILAPAVGETDIMVQALADAAAHLAGLSATTP